MPHEPSFTRGDVVVFPGAQRTQTSEKYRAISLFSGAMGLDIGLHQTGRFELLGAVEKIPSFCDTILTNRGSSGVLEDSAWVYQGDIGKLDPPEMMDDLGLVPGELDVLVGGPPCQAFSTAGGRASLQDPRGTLLWQYLRFVEALQPKIFLMENVRGLMSAAVRHRPIALRPDKGGPPLAADERPGSVVDLFMKDLHGDYRLDLFEVNAVNYGAPQIRERVLFVGNRMGIKVDFPAPSHVSPDELAAQGGAVLFAADELRPWRTLGDALAGLTEHAPVEMDFSPRKKRFLAMVPPGSNWRSLSPEVGEESMGRAFFAKGGRSGWWRRLSFDLPSPTIVTMPNHASTALCHPTETRALTLRECARVQEFPDAWQFRGRPSEQFIQVGNAVPVRLGRVAGDVIAGALNAGAANASTIAQVDLPTVRQVYVKSHVRTRRWFKGGQVVTWQDGTSNDGGRYGAAKTLHKERDRTRSV